MTIKIKMFITDVDGVLTDGGMYYTDQGYEIKKFHAHDGMGFNLLKQNDIKTAIITKENTVAVENRGKKLQLDYVKQAVDNKLITATELCQNEDINLSAVAYIGDDVNDIELLTSVGLSACPNDAVKKVRELPGIIVLKNRGGKGVVREFIDYIIENNYI